MVFTLNLFFYIQQSLDTRYDEGANSLNLSNFYHDKGITTVVYPYSCFIKTLSLRFGDCWFVFPCLWEVLATILAGKLISVVWMSLVRSFVNIFYLVLQSKISLSKPSLMCESKLKVYKLILCLFYQLCLIGNQGVILFL